MSKIRRPHSKVTKDWAQILWALKLQGDINENHAGGNASGTLNKRLKELGVEVDPKQMYNRVTSLEGRGYIKRLKKDSKVYAIRLAVDPETVGPNPFGDLLPAVVDVDRPVEREDTSKRSGAWNDGTTVAELMQMSLTDRAEFAAQLVRRLTDDWIAHKAAM